MNIFEHVKVKGIGSNSFDLSHDLKYSMNMGELIPTTVVDVLPGDVFEITPSNQLRFQALIAPVMHKITVRTTYFFVPNRILWEGWEDFITGESDDAPPTIDEMSLCEEGMLADYMGIPYDASDDTQAINLLPFAAYIKIWDDYYRDQNLQDEKYIELVSGDNNGAWDNLVYDAPQVRAWEHDYFTSALPFPQKGDAVTLPLTNNQNVDVTLKGSSTNPGLIKKSTDHSLVNAADMQTNALGDMQGGTGPNSAVYDPDGTLEVDINEEAVDITTLRTAFSLQAWLEKNARAGSRYIESIRAHFDVKSSDQRLQRPEYIGGSTQNMVISEVLSTAETVGSTPVGEMAGHGISVGGGNTFKYRAEEHGFIIGIINVQPNTAYQQGLPRMFSRPTKLDYFWNDFANVGEQPILMKELYVNSLSASVMESTFGYIPRYSEYHFMNSRVAAQMRNSLNFWHLGRKFASQPSLNASFIECRPSTRIFAVEAVNLDQIVCHTYVHMKAIRKMPKYAIPSI